MIEQWVQSLNEGHHVLYLVFMSQTTLSSSLTLLNPPQLSTLSSSSMDIAGDGGSKVVETVFLRSHDMFLRILSLLLSVVAITVMVVDKEDSTVPLSVVDGMPPLQVPVTAKWHYLSSNVFFVVSNAIAAAYAVISLLWSLTLRTPKRQQNVGYFVMIILDVMIMGLLLSAIGAAVGVGYIAEFGNSHTTWTKVCNVFNKYCHDMVVSFVASMLSSLVFLWMVVMALINLISRNRFLHNFDNPQS